MPGSCRLDRHDGRRLRCIIAPWGALTLRLDGVAVYDTPV